MPGIDSGLLLNLIVASERILDCEETADSGSNAMVGDQTVKAGYLRQWRQGISERLLSGISDFFEVVCGSVSC